MKAITLLFLLLHTSFIFGQFDPVAIDQYLKTYDEAGDFSGCIRIVKGEKLLYENCLGQLLILVADRINI